MLQAVLDDLELELSHRSDDLTTVELAHKELRYTFVHELVDTLIELFLLHGIRIVNVFEHLRREGRKTFEMQVFTGRERVSDLEVTGIGQTHYVSCKRFIDGLFLLRHEAGRSCKTHLLILAHVIIIGVAQELTGTDLEEGDARAVVRIHVRVDLKAERGELIFHRFNGTLFGYYRKRRGCILYEKIKEFLHTDGLVR